MENQIQEPQPLTQPSPGGQVAVDAQNFKKKLKTLSADLKIKFNNLSKNSKILVVTIAVIFLIILVLSVLVALFGKRQRLPVLTASPTPIAVTPPPNIILNASRYATDSGVLKIESNLNEIQKQLEASDVKQSNLSVPNLDFNINFNK